VIASPPNARPPNLDDLIPDFAVIPAQTTRDLLDRQTADEHIT
jgi:hypothetical protein